MEQEQDNYTYLTSESIGDKLERFKQNGIKQFTKVFAWYVLVIALIIGIIFSLNPVIDINLSSKTFVVNSLVFITCNFMVFYSFLTDGVRTSLNSKEYKESKDNYRSQKGNISRADCNKALVTLNKKHEQEFKVYATNFLGLSIEEIEALDLGNKKTWLKYSRRARLIIKAIQSMDYMSPYPDNSEYLFYADNDELRGKLDHNAHVRYIAFISTRKLIISILLSLGACAIVINSVRESNPLNVIVTVFFYMLTLGMSLFAGYDGGQKSIKNYKQRYIDYCASIFKEIKELGVNNG